MSVFVINQRGEPLMPCSNRKSRLLLKEGKAIIYSYLPFTIKLTFATGESNQLINIGVDTGSKHIGISLRNDDKLLQKVDIELRQDVSDLLTSRRTMRRSRRNKLRYRQARFLNRAKSKGWLPPSTIFKVNHTIRWIEKYQSKVPKSKLIIEVGNFDIAKMINPDIENEDYQKGQQLGYENVKSFVRARDNYTCQYCKKCKDVSLDVHHIIFRSNGGTNKPDNLITLCTACHKDLHSDLINPKFKKPKQYKEPVFMNIVKNVLQDYFLDVEFTYGYITTVSRRALGLAKTHANDAIAISGAEKILKDIPTVFIKQQRKKKRSLHEATARKGRKTPNTESKRNSKNTSRVKNFYLFDKVIYNDAIGWISGFTGVGGYIIDFNGNYIQETGKTYKQVSLSKLELVHHTNNWRGKII